MQTLDKWLYALTRSKYRPTLQEYLRINKEIVENHLYHSTTWFINQQTNGAVVLIKMREVYEKILSLPETLSKDIETEDINEQLANEAKKIIEDMS